MKKIQFFLGFLIFLALPVRIDAATFVWEQSDVKATVGTETRLQLRLDTENASTSGVDIIFSYDPNAVEVNGVKFNGPFLYAQNLFSIDSGNRQIRITSSNIDASSSFSGKANYLYLLLTPKTTGSTNFSFSCTQDETSDTNIVSKNEGEDLVTCSRLVSAKITSSTTNVTTTPTPTPTTSGSCTVPGSVTGVTATAGSDGRSVTLSWKAVNGASWYSLEYGKKANTYTFGATNIGNGTAFKVEALTPNTMYYFAVSGVNNCGTSTAGKTSTTTLAASTGTPLGSGTPSPTSTFGPPGTFGSLVSPSPTPEEDAFPGDTTPPTETEGEGYTLDLSNFPFAAVIILAGLAFVVWLYFHRTKNKQKGIHFDLPEKIKEKDE